MRPARSPTERTIGRLRNLGDVVADPREALDYYAQSAALWLEAGHEAAAAWAILCQATMLGRMGDFETARTRCEQSLAVARQPGNDRFLCWILFNYAEILFRAGETEAVHEPLEVSLALFRAQGSLNGATWAQNLQGRLALRAGDYEAAGAHLAQCLRVFRSRENASGIATTLLHQGRLAQALGNPRQAAAHFSECLRLQSDLWHVLSALDQIASLAVSESAYARAARLFGVTTALRAALPYPYPPEKDVFGNLSSVRAALGDSALQAAWEAGAGMTLEQAVSLALREA